jgi:uncharacterized cupin superfamily protein
MSDTVSPVVHLADLKCEPFTHGEAYASQDAGISELLGLTRIGAAYTKIPPGKSDCPFHVHHEEDEMFVILEGNGEYRFGTGVFGVGPGDVLGAPRGGSELAHKLTNTGTTVMTLIGISSKANTEVCEYPDSNKFMVRSRISSGNETSLRFIGRLGEGVDYWDGEEGCD